MNGSELQTNLTNLLVPKSLLPRKATNSNVVVYLEVVLRIKLTSSYPHYYASSQGESNATSFLLRIFHLEGVDSFSH